MPLTSPRETTIRQLFAVSMNRCAFPGCTTPIVDSETNTILAEVCHIHAQRENGPRYDATQTDEERHGYNNLILMCSVHHKIIDASENASAYSAEHLRELKQRHEDQARSSPAAVLPALSVEMIKALMQSVTRYESEAVHMDFRNATFQVGGGGGHWGGGGGGGSGGVLTIVGTTRVPPDAATILAGQKGQAPGGGGGVINFVGRPVNPTDLANGLRVSSIFMANAASLAGLINILGGGWSQCPVPHTPRTVSLKLILVFELGRIEPQTNLRMDVVVLDPAGNVASTTFQDVAVPPDPDPVVRVSAIHRLKFEVSCLGIWRILIRSSDIDLADHSIEFRKGKLVESAE